MEPSKKRLLAAVYALAFGFGLTCTMIAPLVSLILDDFSITTAQGGLLMTFMNIGALLSVFLVLFFGDRFPKIPVYGLTYLLFSAALLCIVGAPSYAVLLALMLIIGLGSKLVDILGNPILADAFPVGGERYLNLLHMFLSGGACIGPLLLQAALDAGCSWRIAFAGVGAFCCLLLAVSAPALLHAAKQTTAVKAAESGPFRVTPILLFLGLITLFNQSHQIIVNTWGTLYAQRALGLSGTPAVLTVPIFWAGIILARLIASRIARPDNTQQLILWGSFGGGAALVLAAVLSTPAAAYVGLFLAGLLGGAVIPLAISRLCALYPSASGRVTSAIFLTLVTASLAVPALSGSLADAAGFLWTMVVSGVFLLVSAVIAVAAGKARS